jgi:hypothetical protein
MVPRATSFLVGLATVMSLAVPAAATERLCDPAEENCREILLSLIRAEREGIDVAFWFMEDARYSNELVKKASEGVPIRVLVDTRAPSAMNGQILNQLAAAGIPMRRRTASGVLHWKMMLFTGQQTVQFSGANYSAHAFTPQVPYSNYVAEAIFFSDDRGVVQSFMRRFDDLWTNTHSYANYANIGSSLVRRYPLYDLDSDLNLPSLHSYRARAVAAYRAEPRGIDVIMYRITDRAHADAMIDAVRRGVRVRLITEPLQYRDPSRLWHSWNVDRMHMAGVEVRHRAHAGLMHQKSVVLRGQGLAIFGSSNWTSPSSDTQEEHNYFTTKGWIVQWFEAQFERKWHNLAPAAETEPFQPLPPASPGYQRPASGATGVATSTALVFDAGPYAHTYDIYFGTSPDPPLLEADVALGPTPPGGSPRHYPLPQLAPHATYYWRVVARTAARLERGQAVWSFSTGDASVSVPSSGTEPALAPTPAPVPVTCTSAPPAPGWVCIGDGWVPANHPLAIAPAAPAPSAPPPPPASQACSGGAPAPGWVCVNGGWVPADHPLAAAAGTSAPAVPSEAPPVTTQTCAGLPPGPGWICVNGGWVPADHPLARGG